jgi:hypothetical protein
MAKAFPNTGVTTGLAADRTAMTGMTAGTYFYETDTKKTFVYNGSSWVEDNNYNLTYVPSFHVTGNGGFVTVAAGAAAPFNYINMDTGSNFNTTNNRFVAPVAGIYLFGVSMYSNGSCSMCFAKNGSQTYQTADLNPLMTAPSTPTGLTFGSSIILTLAVNDYVDVRSRNLQSSGIYIPHSSFWGYLIK